MLKTSENAQITSGINTPETSARIFGSKLQIITVLLVFTCSWRQHLSYRVLAILLRYLQCFGTAPQCKLCRILSWICKIKIVQLYSILHGQTSCWWTVGQLILLSWNYLKAALSRKNCAKSCAMLQFCLYLDWSNPTSLQYKHPPEMRVTRKVWIPFSSWDTAATLHCSHPSHLWRSGTSSHLLALHKSTFFGENVS